jgi:NADPH-dependent 2,4-dienoyl-CoA reductase/sulfur reductase-like enzyme
MKEVNLVIIGGGPAGITAATEAARMGASVAIIDENQHLGGKVLAPTSNAIQASVSDRIEKNIRRQLLKDFDRVKDKISLYLNTEVWDIVDQKMVLFYSNSGSAEQVKRIKGDKLIISVGAFEKAIPFPGWTLPGVFSVGKREFCPGNVFCLPEPALCSLYWQII